MDITTAALLRSQAAQYKTSLILSSSDQHDVPPMMPVEAQAQNEYFLSLKSGDDMNKGLLTGVLGGWGSPMAVFLAVDAIKLGNSTLALQLLLFALAMFLIPFLWEVLSPVSPSPRLPYLLILGQR